VQIRWKGTFQIKKIDEPKSHQSADETKILQLMLRGLSFLVCNVILLLPLREDMSVESDVYFWLLLLHKSNFVKS